MPLFRLAFGPRGFIRALLMGLPGLRLGVLFGRFNGALILLSMVLPGLGLWVLLVAVGDLGLGLALCISGRVGLTLPSFSSCSPGMGFRRRRSTVALARIPVLP